MQARPGPGRKVGALDVGVRERAFQPDQQHPRRRCRYQVTGRKPVQAVRNEVERSADVGGVIAEEKAAPRGQ